VKVSIKRKEFKKILTRENISQNKLAFSLGISSGYMSQLMNSDREPSPKLRKRIMETLPIHKWMGISIRYKWDDLFKIKE